MIFFEALRTKFSTVPLFIYEKRGGANFPLGLYGGLYGHNLQYKFKKSIGDFLESQFRKIT